MGARKSLVPLPPAGADGGIARRYWGGWGVWACLKPVFYPASIFSLVMAWNFGWLAAVYSMLILSPQFGNITFFLPNIF